MCNYIRNVLKPFILIYIVCSQVVLINSKTSILWKLNVESGKIDSFGEKHQLLNKDSQELYDNDRIFKIITSTAQSSCGNGWNRKGDMSCNCDESSEHFEETSEPNNPNDLLDCGKVVNSTNYDDLIGIADRHNHPLVPEPEVALQFLKHKSTKNLHNFNIDALERRLKKAKSDRGLSIQLINQIGNFWRIKGNATMSIDCFRRALSISPTNSEVLLNLARVLFNLQYLDDAAHLTRRSIEVKSADHNAWRQYYTLGEIFKAYGHFQESILHLRHALDLHPDYEPIEMALRDAEEQPSSSMHIYTFIIIVCLVVGVLLVILSTSETTAYSQEALEPKSQRHFNRAMAMRSLKGLTPRSTKYKKYY